MSKKINELQQKIDVKIKRFTFAKNLSYLWYMGAMSYLWFQGVYLATAIMTVSAIVIHQMLKKMQWMETYTEGYKDAMEVRKSQINKIVEHFEERIDNIEVEKLDLPKNKMNG